jgi:tetratricopeptide (TPR) repeat protein
VRILDRLQDGLGEFIDELTLPERIRSRLDEGGRLLAAGHAAAALDVARAVDAERPGLWRTHLVAGLSLEVLGRLDEAVAELEKAAGIRDAAILRVALGRVYLRLDQTVQARTNFEAALERHPGETERLNALLGLAAVHEHDGPIVRAVGPLRAALKLAGADEQVRLRLGRALHGAGDDVGVIALIEPDAAHASSELLRLLAASLQRRNAGGDAAAAESVYRAIVDRMPEDADAIEQIANLHLRRRDVSGALGHFRRALGVAPVVSHARLLAGVAQCHLAAGQPVDALDSLRAAVGLAPDALAAIAPYAALAVEHGPVEEADEATLRWLALEPDSRRATALRGRALLRRGDVDEARRVIAPLRAAVMSADEVDALARLALALGEAAEALALTQELIALEPARAASIEVVRNAAWNALTPSIALPGNRAAWTTDVLGTTLDDVAAALARFPRLARQAARIDAISRRLDSPLKIAVLGEFNAGKSTLINAFLGELIVPVGVLPTTSRINVVRYGPRPIANIGWADGVDEIVPASGARDRLRERDVAVERLDFEWPHPELRAVHLWDTPGFNAPDARHEAEALRALAEADAIIWIVDANQAMSATELDRVRQLADADEKLLVTINKDDRLGDDLETREVLRAHVDRALGSNYAAMVFVSARRALEARVAGDSGALAASGWPEFEAVLRRQLFDRADRIKALDAAAALARELRALEAQGHALAETASSQRSRLTELRRDIEGWQARFVSLTVQPVTHALTGALQKARIDAAAEVAELVAGTATLLGRPRLTPDDRETVLRHLGGAVGVAYCEAVDAVGAVASELRRDVLLVTEHVCAVLGGDEARVMRRRVESFAATDAAMTAALRDRACGAAIDVFAALSSANGAAAIDGAIAELARGGAADSAFSEIVAAPSDAWRDRLVDWGTSWVEAVLTLVERMVRDLEQVALDVERRIIQPLHAVLDALEPRAAAEPSAKDPADDQA